MTHPLFNVDLETILTGKDFADLPASPLQVGIARAGEGRATDGVLSGDELQRYFGVEHLDDLITGVFPTLVVIVAGVRGGKSFLAACAAIRGCLRVDLSRLKPYELPRFAIIAPRVDAAAATFKLLLGILQASPILRLLIEGDPTSDTIFLRRPDGRRVEIVVVAAASGGVTVRNRWLVGFVLEEVAQLGAEAMGAVVSAEEILRAAETRLLPGAQGWLISSPFGPQGLLYQLWKQYFGAPSRRALVVHAPTRALNPSFPEEQIEAIRKEAPDVAAREHDALWVDAETAFLAAMLIDAARRTSPLIRPPSGFACAWGMDGATRGNSWTLVNAWREGKRTIIGGSWQWTGSKVSPLSPDATFAEIAPICRQYGNTTILCDQWSFDANRDLAARHGLKLVEVPSSQMQACYGQLQTVLGNGELELPPDPVVRTDLMGIRKIATANTVRIVLVRTPDGRHCDYAPSTAIACAAVAVVVASEDHRAESARIVQQLETQSAWGSGPPIGQQILDRSARIERQTKTLLENDTDPWYPPPVRWIPPA